MTLKYKKANLLKHFFTICGLNLWSKSEKKLQATVCIGDSTGHSLLVLPGADD